jgi:hypothetical protein
MELKLDHKKISEFVMDTVESPAHKVNIDRQLKQQSLKDDKEITKFIEDQKKVQNSLNLPQKDHEILDVVASVNEDDDDDDDSLDELIDDLVISDRAGTTSTNNIVFHDAIANIDDEHVECKFKSN